MNLYFNKIKRTGGNINLASKSLAPAWYSYHTIGDFDVGKKGWGYKNFTASFITTKEFWRLRRLSYVSIRYTLNNKDGVRFEPWHVKTI
jgi:LAS superfamily LD-carboxypeptidase LdcB